VNENDRITADSIQQMTLLSNIKNVIAALKDMEERTLLKIRKQFEDINFEDDKQILANVQSMLLQCGAQEMTKTHNGGYIIWLRLAFETESPSPFIDFNPTPCNYYPDFMISTEAVDGLPNEIYVDQIKQYVQRLDDEAFEKERDSANIDVEEVGEIAGTIRENAVVDLLNSIMAKKKGRKNREQQASQEAIREVEIRQENQRSKSIQKQNDRGNPVQRCAKIVAAAQDIFLRLKKGKIFLTHNEGNSIKFIIS
jgi:hypothetical protein